MKFESERQKAITSLVEMIKEIGVAMLTTVMPDGTLRSRPMISAEPEFGGDRTEPGDNRLAAQLAGSDVAENQGGPVAGCGIEIGVGEGAVLRKSPHRSEAERQT